MSRIAALMLATALAGCATYTPLPLPSTPDLPAARDAAIDLARPIDPVAIATIAAINNPDLKAQRQRAGVAEAQLFAARLLPDPTFSIGAAKVVSGPDPFADVASALGFNLADLRSRGVRLAAARASLRQVRRDLAWAEWQTAGQARLQAARIRALEQASILASASRDAAQALLDRMLRAAGRGDLMPDQVQSARIGAFGAQETARATERDLAAARFELAKLLGLPSGARLRLAPVAPADAPPDAARLYALAAAQRADLQALRAGYDAQEAAVRKAVLDQFPTLGLTINGSRDSAGNLLVGPAVDITLPLWNRNRGGIAIERATRAALKAEYEARLFQTRADIAAAVAGIAIARRQREGTLRDLPALERLAAASGRAADRGDLAPATAQTAAQVVRDRRTLLVQSDQAIAEQTIALELLTGTPKEDWPR